MKLLRTIPWFTRVLVALFLAAQFAGVVSLPRAHAVPMTSAGAPHAAASVMDASHVDASMVHHHWHAQAHGGDGMPCGHHDHGSSLADTCCALHACFAGLMPPAVAIAAASAASEPLLAGADDLAAGVPGGRLDRPPRPQH
jgi:hypothetical protein